MAGFLCGIPYLAGFLAACAAGGPDAIGYAEGDYISLAPIETARIEQIAVRRGDILQAGDVVARLERADAEIAVSDAEARLREAEAALADEKLGERPEELAVKEAAVTSAEAELRDASRSLARQRTLAERGTGTQAALDEAIARETIARASVGQAKANLEVARLPAREDRLRVLQAQVEQARAALDRALWALDQRTISAPAAGRVADIVRHAGDVAGPSAPVISFLPDGAVKLKFYVPENSFANLHLGDRLAVSCDGCPADMGAQISYIAPEPEFTPPVIYSLETRQTLVYLIEAKPEGEAGARLQPGQIVDARLPDKATRP